MDELPMYQMHKCEKTPPKISITKFSELTGWTLHCSNMVDGITHASWIEGINNCPFCGTTLED